MHPDYWFKQIKDTPLFPDILWSRPENKQSAGKLLVVGGNTHGFIDVGLSYQAAAKAGAGTIHVLLPDGLRKTVGATLENCEFAPTTPSGSFARTSLNELLIHAAWADCVLLAGEFGRNSETAVMLEAFVQKYSGPLVLTRDSIDYFFNHSSLIIDRPDTCIVSSLGQLQKLAADSHFDEAITTTLDLLRLVPVIHNFATIHKAHLVTHSLGTTIVAADSKVSSTITGTNEDVWRVPTAANAAVFWMQTPSKSFEAITTSLL
jgi:ADP-dependent NAD(P)H-hydrate dehydratase / NAD(P)H-hydrate epimerase